MIKPANRCVCAAAIGALAGPAMAGPEWVEGNDAGSLPPSAQIIGGTGTLTKIAGSLLGSNPIAGGDGDFVDMYVLQINDPLLFSATTTFLGGGSADFDSQLWLFKLDGLGLLGNDDTFVVGGPGFGKGSIVSGSTLGPMATDGSGQTIPGAGLYLLAISGEFHVPASPAGHIFSFANPTEISGPDGQGGTQSVTFWENTSLNSPSFGGATGDYLISLTGTALVPPSLFPVNLDIKPGGCPNPFNRKSNGVTPVSLLGTSAFDVHTINLSTVVMSRADGVGGVVHPHEGPPGPHSVFEDTGTPFDGEECECSSAEGDGIVDLSMKFKSQEMVSAMQLNDLPSGSLVTLRVTGQLNDGTAFTSSDCIRLVPPGTPPGQLLLQSNISGAWLDTSPLDLQLDGGGFANYERTYPQTTVVALSAAPTVDGHVFKYWLVNGAPQLQLGATMSVVVNGQTQTIQAVYGPSK